MESTKEEYLIGIDFGTCNSCVGIWKNNIFEIIPDEKGFHTIPSIVAFTNRTQYVGLEAKNQTELNPSNVFYEIKRLLGKKIDDESVINDLQFLTYKLIGDEHKNIKVVTDLENDKIHKREYTPEEIASMILMKLKHMAINYLKQNINKAVISVPAYFNDAQRQATKDAAQIAGLECVRIINEPVASALAYGLNKLSQVSGSKIVIVYDLGGGTLDVSLLSINDGIFEVLASVGNTHLGGSDFDNRIYSFCINQFKREHHLDNISGINKLSLQNLRRSCENAKKILSTSQKTIIGVTNFYKDMDLIIQITRNKFEEICNDLFVMCLKPMDDILKACHYERKQIDEIILVGGMTRVPRIRDNINKFFDKPPNESVNPDEAVVTGASIQGFILSHKSDPFSESVTLMDVTTLSLGVETIGGVMSIMIPRGTVIPITTKKIFSNDTDDETSITIKVFEGERSMTKDNFLVGEFELSGICKAPRGYHKIEVTFHIDIDGIITVTAEDLRSNIKNSIRTNGNKGRLTQEKIKELIKESNERELQDKMLRKKKKAYYKIDEMCSNIMKNLQDPEMIIGETEKKIVLDDINNITKWLKEKVFYEREKDEYKNIIDRLSKKYCILILNASNKDSKVLANSQQTSDGGTTVFQDDDEHDQSATYEKIINNELGLADDTSEVEKNEIVQMRTSLVDLCHTIYEIVGSNNLSISETHKEELKDYIDDILLWVHIQQKSTISDYKQKIDEVTIECNKIVEHYDSDIFSANASTSSSRDELEQLCLTIKSSIVSNLFSFDEQNIKLLEKTIDDTLNWMIEVTTQKDIKDSDYKNKIDYINILCTELSKMLLNPTIEKDIKIV